VRVEPADCSAARPLASSSCPLSSTVGNPGRSSRDYDQVQVATGQRWELPSESTDDLLVLKIIEVVDDDYAVVHTVRRSAPDTVLNRSNMRLRDVIDTGVLVAGPGALDARTRRERADHLSALLRYAAKRSGSPTRDRQVRFDGQEVVGLVAKDESVTRQQARAMLRDALASLGGREITSAYDPDEIGYVIPVAAPQAE
jgi:hypothetical protein